MMRMLIAHEQQQPIAFMATEHPHRKQADRPTRNLLTGVTPGHMYVKWQPHKPSPFMS